MKQRGQRKIKVGKVVSNKMDKTITIALERRIQHPLYKKYLTKRSKIYGEDSENQCRIGDMVKVIETRPLSKLKRWRLLEIMERAK